MLAVIRCSIFGLLVRYPKV